MPVITVSTKPGSSIPDFCFICAYREHQSWHRCGHPDLCLQGAGELSLSGHLVTGPEGGAVFIGASQALPLEVVVPLEMPGARTHVLKGPENPALQPPAFT